MEILDDQQSANESYDSKSLQNVIATYCGLLSLGCLWIYWNTIPYALLRGGIHWIFAGVYFVVWTKLKQGITAGIVIYLIWQTCYLIAEIDLSRM